MSDEMIFDRPLIAYDGSRNCQILAQIFKKMYSKFQQSTFLHVWNPDRTYLPPPTKGPMIEEAFKQNLTGCDKNINFKLATIQRDQPSSVNQILLKNFLTSKSTFLMFGFYGSKGKKVRPEDLSSRVRRFVYDSKNNVAIIKNNCRQTGVVGFCCDGSEISMQGLQKCIIFCKKFGYSIKVVHTYNQTNKTYSKIIKNQLKAILNKTQIKSEIFMEQSVNIVDTLKSMEQNFDWIFLTRNGYRGEISKRNYVGSKTTDILVNVQANIIIVS